VSNKKKAGCEVVAKEGLLYFIFLLGEYHCDA
jgi:hypothetical protein